jgi:predicted nucleotidyltransferase
MRLTAEQTRAILDTTHHHLGNTAQVVLFGSRANDATRGGDIDLLIETPAPVGYWRRAQLLAALEQGLGLPCDIVVYAHGEPERPIHRIARLSGIVLS